MGQGQFFPRQPEQARTRLGLAASPATRHQAHGGAPCAGQPSRAAFHRAPLSLLRLRRPRWPAAPDETIRDIRRRCFQPVVPQAHQPRAAQHGTGTPSRRRSRNQFWRSQAGPGSPSTTPASLGASGQITPDGTWPPGIGARLARGHSYDTRRPADTRQRITGSPAGRATTGSLDITSAPGGRTSR